MGIRGYAVLLAGLCLALEARAQTPQDIERAQQQGQQLLQQQQQLERQQRELEEARRRAPSGQALKPGPLPAPAGPGAACHRVNEIVLEGASKLDTADQARLAAPYLDRCVSLADINRLIGAITNRYVERGYVTTRVYIPQQDLGGGRLLLKVLEGRIQSLVIEPASSASAATAFPGLAGAVLNLRDIEQGLDQVNRLASNSAKIDIEPGDEPGQSRVVIRNDARKRLVLSASADNAGGASTGRTQYTGFVGADHLFGANDYLSATVRMSRESGREYTESGSLYTAVPYGYWTFSASASKFRYASLVQGAVSTFQTSGDSEAHLLHADRVVYRDQAVKWTVGGGYTGKRTRNDIAGLRIDNSSADLALLDLSTSLNVIAAGALLSFDLAAVEGLDTLGATRDDPARPADAPQARFSKVSYGASVTRPFTLGGMQFSWRSALSGQSSSDPLYGTEQIAIGSLYSVRGFRRTTLSGRSGYYVRSELDLRQAFGMGRVRPYAGFDFGHVEGADSLQSWTTGLDVSVGGAALQFAYSEPISAPEGFSRESGWTYLRLAFTY